MVDFFLSFIFTIIFGLQDFYIFVEFQLIRVFILLMFKLSNLSSIGAPLVLVPVSS